MKIERYGTYVADLEPVRGGEMAKARPVVVVSMDEMNTHLSTVVVCPLTTKLHPKWRSRIQVTVDGKPAEIAVDQIRTLSKQRLAKRIGKLSTNSAALVRRLISEITGIANQ